MGYPFTCRQRITYPFSGTPSPYSVFSTKQIQNLTSSTPTKKSVAKCCQHLQRTRKCPIYQVSFASSPVYLSSPWGGLSSPKEAFRTAEAAVLGASAIFDPISPFAKRAFGAFFRDFGVLPSVAKLEASVYQGFRVFIILEMVKHFCNITTEQFHCFINLFSNGVIYPFDE